MADTQESTALVSLNLNLPAPAFVAEQINKAYGTIYTKIEEEIAAFVPDVTTEKGRKAIASFAYKIARTKTGLDEAAKAVTADQKAIIDAVNAERSKAWDDIEALQAKARQPLTDWENAEKARQTRVAETIMDLSGELIACNHNSSQWIADTITEIENHIYCEEVFGPEGVEKIEAQRAENLEAMRTIYARRLKEEHEAAELEQLRREKAEREAAEAARIAEEERKAAEAAEIARREEERARIAREAEEKAKRDAAEAIERAEREAAAAEQRAEEAEEREAKRVEDEKRRAIEEEEARKEAAARAEEQARQREEKAKQDERDRIAREQAAKIKADQERAADEAHRRKINTAAVAAIVKAAGITEKEAQSVIIAIYKDQVPHVSISY